MIVPSKINLFLQVLGKRPDSYHELDMVFFPLSEPADTMEIKPVSDGVTRILCDAEGVPCDPEKNLCGKAVSAYFKAAGKPPQSFQIRLEKRIPVAAGMGGGSSDAAAALSYLQEQFGYLTPDQLHQTALSLGADVPYFLNPVPARARGVGEKITVLSDAIAKLPIRLYAPGFPVSAKWSYTHMEPPDPKDPRKIEEVIRGLETNDLERIAANMRNDLEPAVLRKFPILKLAADAMRCAGAIRTMVSGSGPTLFGLFPEQPEQLWFEWEAE